MKSSNLKPPFVLQRAALGCHNTLADITELPILAESTATSAFNSLYGSVLPREPLRLLVHRGLLGGQLIAQSKLAEMPELVATFTFRAVCLIECNID